MDIKISVCDDNIAVTQLLQELLFTKIKWNNNNIIVDKFNNGRNLLEMIRNGKSYDIIFLDIDLKDDYLGTDTGRFIKIISPNTLIIYMSAYDNYYSKIVHAEPFDFISKPFTIIQLQAVIDKAVRRLQFQYEEYVYKYNVNRLQNIIDLKQVLYFESQYRVINIHHKNGIGRFYHKLDNVEQEVSEICDFFVRCNKGFLVNMMYIKHFSPHMIEMTDGKIIAISKKYKENVVMKMLNK